MGYNTNNKTFNVRKGNLIVQVPETCLTAPPLSVEWIVRDDKTNKVQSFAAGVHSTRRYDYMWEDVRENISTILPLVRTHKILELFDKGELVIPPETMAYMNEMLEKT